VVLSQFIYLQLALALIGLGAVYFFHARRLLGLSRTLTEAFNAARTDNESNNSDQSRIAWFNARGSAIEPTDPATQVRKVVLECEGKDPKRLNNQLKPFLGHLRLKDQWTELRSQQHASAVEQVGENPSFTRSAMDAFMLYSPFDKVFDFVAPEWPALPEGTVGELEALRTQVVDLRSELESATAGTDEDLRKLLKQFTQDSREMMGCIQQLEKENVALKAELEKAAAA
jgi:hypothetical protein